MHYKKGHGTYELHVSSSLEQTFVSKKYFSLFRFRSFRVENLANGEYFYRIRTVSIFGNGQYSSPAIVVVERPNYAVYTVGTVLAICCIAAIILIWFAYKLLRKFLMGRSSDDGERLLNSTADVDDQSSLPEDGGKIIPMWLLFVS